MEQKSISEFNEPINQYLDTDLIGLDQGVELTWVRLTNLLPINTPLNFHRHSVFNRVSTYPTFLSQLSLLSASYYQSLFQEQNVKEDGKYRIVAMVSGLKSNIEIDDYIPVVKSTNKPLWGLEIAVPWTLLILKAWINLIGGARNIRIARPFDFVRTFTYASWIIKDVVRIQTVSSSKQITTTIKDDFHEIQKLLMSNQQVNIFAKTKNHQNLVNYGLESNCLAYRITTITTIRNIPVLRIQSTVRSFWCGEFSLIDGETIRECIQIQPQKKQQGYQKFFIMSWSDFTCLFSTMYISKLDYSKPLQNMISSSFQINHNGFVKESAHFQLSIAKQGLVDIFILQPRLGYLHYQTASEHKLNSQIYMRFKLLVVQSLPLQNSQSVSNIQSVIRKLQSGNNAENTKNTYPESSNPTNPHKYCYNQRQQGYNIIFGHHTKRRSLNTFSLVLIPGKYIIHVKCESDMPRLNHMKNYFGVVHYNFSPIKLERIYLKKNEKSLMLRSAFSSLECKKLYFDEETKREWVKYGATFDEYGYGYVSFCADQKSQFAVYCEFDSNELLEEGYKCKDIYRLENTKIGIYSIGGKQRCIILKKCKKVTEWPPSSIKIFRVQLSLQE